MDTFFAVVVALFVVAVLGLVAYSIFELTPLGRHKDHYRDPLTHKRLHEAPNLEDGHY